MYELPNELTFEKIHRMLVIDGKYLAGYPKDKF